MKQFLSCVLILALASGALARTMPSAKPAEPDVRDDVAGLEPGKVVTLTLAGGKKVQGSVIDRPADSVNLRVGRGFFRYRTESYPVKDIVSVKKHLPSWVGPVVVLGIVGGVVIGVAACVASGTCTN